MTPLGQVFFIIVSDHNPTVIIENEGNDNNPNKRFSPGLDFPSAVLIFS